jgi:histidinol-phosphate/aromatic aminotransferase/cobyric acid decarboxylase-like protein
VRDVGFETYLRITVGYEQEIDRALAGLGALLQTNQEVM